MDGGVQPSSVDLRVDRYFRVFRNDTTPFIDPKLAQEDLTELVEVDADGSFILHPGEFVLGSTLERIALPDDLEVLTVDTAPSDPGRVYVSGISVSSSQNGIVERSDDRGAHWSRPSIADPPPGSLPFIPAVHPLPAHTVDAR